MSDRVRIVSDGTTEGTHVTVDGIELLDVQYVRWDISAGALARVVLIVDDVVVDLTGEHAPCCTACGGLGAAADGPCWDCRGTGHAHA